MHFKSGNNCANILASEMFKLTYRYVYISYRKIVHIIYACKYQLVELCNLYNYTCSCYGDGCIFVSVLQIPIKTVKIKCCVFRIYIQVDSDV